MLSQFSLGLKGYKTSIILLVICGVFETWLCNQKLVDFQKNRKFTKKGKSWSFVHFFFFFDIFLIFWRSKKISSWANL